MSNEIRNCTLRLYPTRNQATKLDGWLELHRLLYNKCLAERRDAWTNEQVSVSYNDQQNMLPAMKLEKPYYILLGSQALQETVRRVDRAFKAFFRRLKSGGESPGYPRFKSFGRYNSFTYPAVAGWKLVSMSDGKGVISISKLGHIKLRGTCRAELLGLDRDQLTCCTIKKNRGKWYATITYSVPLSVLARPVAEDPESMTGVDAGLSSLAVFADGNEVPRIRHLDKSLKKIKSAQRDVSRKQKGSNNRRKSVQKLSRLHERVANQRKDYLEKESARIVSSYQFVAIEDLSVKNMMKPGSVRKRGLNRSMADASLGQFLSLIASKAGEAGCNVVKVNPRGTTQCCSRCGVLVPKRLYDRVHSCPGCGLIMDRDHNAAINILFRGLALAGREPSELWRDSRLVTYNESVLMKQETVTIQTFV